MKHFYQVAGFTADGWITVICSANAAEWFVMECALLGICDSTCSCILHACLFLTPFLFFFNLSKRTIQQCRGWHCLWAETLSHSTLHPGCSLSPAAGSIPESGNVVWGLRGPWSKAAIPKCPPAPFPHISKCPRQQNLHSRQCPLLSQGPWLSHCLSRSQDKSQLEADPQQMVQCLLWYRAEQNEQYSYGFTDPGCNLHWEHCLDM